MTNEELELNVADELFWDPKVDSTAIAVSADGGSVTLRGTVGSLRQKREAKRAAERVWGVGGVKNLLNVQILTEQRRADADLRGDVLQALMLDAQIPTTVDVRAKDGFVTLEGDVDWQYQRDEAEFVAGNVLGVAGVHNELVLIVRPVDPGSVQQSITRAFTRDAKLDSNNLTVATSDSAVILSGTVRSWSEHDAAVAAAWASPGVRAVEDRLSVSY